jgi:hypothetical protein
MLAVLSLSIAATSQASIIASDTDLGDVTSAIINHVFTATDGTEPYFWSDLTSTVGSPAFAATLSADGSFEWNTADSARPGIYSFEATVTDSSSPSMTDVGTLTLNLQGPNGTSNVPEPASWATWLLLLGACMIGWRRFRPR